MHLKNTLLPWKQLFLKKFPFLLCCICLIVSLCCYGAVTYSVPAIKFRIVIPILWSFFLTYAYKQKTIFTAGSFFIFFFLYIVSDALTYGKVSSQPQLAYFLLTTLSFYIYSVGLKKRNTYTQLFLCMVFILNFIILLVPLMYLGYYVLYGVPVTADVLLALLQTNFNEAYEYVIDQIPLLSLVPLALVSVWLIGLAKVQRLSNVPLKKYEFLFILPGLVLLFVCYTGELRLFGIVQVVSDYQAEIEKFKVMKKELDQQKSSFSATKTENIQGETYLIVIGESLNKQHMSIYGYPRQTTPEQQKIIDSEGSILFEAAYSNHTHTVPTLQYALTEANQINHKKIYNAVSLIDVFKKVGFETYWLSNQAIYGAWDTPLSIIAASADKVIALNKSYGKTTRTQQYDAALIDKLELILKEKKNKNKVIFIHLIGNHGSYEERYPKEYSRYSGSLPTSLFGAKSATWRHKNINSYDNSVLYNDYVVSSLYKIIKAQSQNAPTAFMYLSDHADDVVKNRRHDSGRFTYEMTQIPFWIWCSPAYRATYSDTFDHLRRHKFTLFSNDFLYDTLLGITHVTTDRYNAYADLTTLTYSLSPNAAKTLHGTRDYSDASNHIYWSTTNMRTLSSMINDKIFGLVNVATRGKLKEVIQMGCETVTIPVYMNHNGTLNVGKNSNGDTALEKLLSGVSYQLKNIVIRLAHGSINDISAVVESFEKLDQQCNIKRKVTIEIDSQIQQALILEKKGWKLSYKIVSNSLHSDAELKSISQYLKQQRISVISVSNSEYNFIKASLAKQLNTHFSFYVYEPELLLTSKDLTAKILERSYVDDPSIIGIMLSYSSRFDL